MMQIARSDYTAVDRLIHSGPCIVKSIMISAEASAGACKVYDGHNTKGTVKAGIKAIADSSFTWTPGEGTDFENGIYLDISGGVTDVTVTYIPESRKDFI